jgi:hypothetical protein
VALLFQSIPTQWDLRIYFRPGEKVSWFVTRYLSYMKPGKLTLLWQAQGKEKEAVKGLYGWGILQDEPTRDTHGRLRVPLMFIERWVSARDIRNDVEGSEQVAAISASDVLELPSWKDHLLAKMPIGTNFLISAKQLEELNEIVAVRYPTSAFSCAAIMDKDGIPIEADKFVPGLIKETGDPDSEARYILELMMAIMILENQKWWLA